MPKGPWSSRSATAGPGPKSWPCHSCGPTSARVSAGPTAARAAPAFRNCRLSVIVVPSRPDASLEELTPSGVAHAVVGQRDALAGLDHLEVARAEGREVERAEQ